MTFDDIQKTFIISLFGSDRRDVVKKEMRDHFIYFEFWDGVKKEDGAAGLKEAFHQIFETCLQKGHFPALIFEDDVRFKTDMATTKMQWVMEDLPKDFHICKFGANLLHPVEQVTEYISRIRMSYALHAAIYSKEAMEKILKIKSNDPIDMDIAKFIEPMGKCFVSNEMIATQRVTKSDIFVYNPQKHNRAFSDKYMTDDGMVRWDIFMDEQWQKNMQLKNKK